MQSEFWTRTIDAHLLRAVIDWCMVFGTDKNPTHWKNLPATNKNHHIKEFRRLLKMKADLSPVEWEDYWLKMLDFRDNYAAHRTLQETFPAPPCFDKALEVVFIYDWWLRKDMEYATMAEPPLQESYKELLLGVKPPLRELLRTSLLYTPSLCKENEPTCAICTSP